MIGIDDVVLAVTGILESWRPQFDAALSAAAPIPLAGIYPFVTNNLAFGELPVIMVSAEEESVEWIGLPNIAQEQFNLGIWSLVHHEEPGIAQRMLRIIGAQLKACLNHRDRLCWEVPDGVMYFDKRLPLSRIRYGAGANMSSSLVPALSAQFTSNACVEPVLETFQP